MVIRAAIASKALLELGPSQMGWYVIYQLGLHSGWLRYATRSALRKMQSLAPGKIAHDLLLLPARKDLADLLGQAAQHDLLQQANEISAGWMRIFSGDLAPIAPTPASPFGDWTLYKENSFHEDIKFTWESGRFGWVYPLGRAYRLTGDDRWPQAFWELRRSFFLANPPYTGPQWLSGQEVALRLISLVYASQVFQDAPSSTQDRQAALAQDIAIHAARIPPGLAYALAQNNNHLLAEAAGLLTASMALPEHPLAGRWQQLGWRWLVEGLQAQIAPDGAYIQHSTNYHRLMLHLVLWVTAIAGQRGWQWPPVLRTRLEVSIRWLAALLDRTSGKLPNLGPNDGAHILPLTQCPYQDFRPVLQAAWRMIFNQPLLPPGQWDETSLWLCQASASSTPLPLAEPQPGSPLILRHPQSDSWCYLRAAQFTSRPGHADQLHLDLWWRGLNLAQDPGTYRYTAPPPWDNALVCTQVHNTITLDQRDQMRRAGRFLYLDWAQARIISQPTREDGSKITASHNGYRNTGVVHERSVETTLQGWKVQDVLKLIQPRRAGSVLAGQMHATRLHWLVPAWECEVQAGAAKIYIKLSSPFGPIQLVIYPPESQSDEIIKPLLAVAGQPVYGDEAVDPTWGWTSPTYNQKEPALSISVHAKTRLPVFWVTEWNLVLA